MKTRFFLPSIFQVIVSTGALFLIFGTSFRTLVLAETKDDTSADNSKVNKMERREQEVTAGQQSNNRSDVQITSKIRQSLMKDKNLSTYAHNVKIITDNGRVTLKGPVRSEEEKRSVEQKAQIVAGADKVNDQMEIASKN